MLHLDTLLAFKRKLIVLTLFADRFLAHVQTEKIAASKYDDVRWSFEEMETFSPETNSPQALRKAR